MPGYTYIGKLKNSFICDERLSGNDIRVYLSLKKWDTWEGKVMIETMADEIGMSRQSFSKSAKLLESLKYIKIVKVSNWDCYKYQILNKAHVKKDDMDVKNINTDVKKVNTNDVKNINPISIPNNIPIKEEQEKTASAGKTPAAEKDKELITEVIKLWNTISGQTLSISTKQYRDSIRWCIGQLNGTDDKLSKFRYAFENKKRMYDDPNHILSQFTLPMILRKGKFSGNVDDPTYKKKEVKEEPSFARKEI